MRTILKVVVILSVLGSMIRAITGTASPLNWMILGAALVWAGIWAGVMYAIWKRMTDPREMDEYDQHR